MEINFFAHFITIIVRRYKKGGLSGVKPTKKVYFCLLNYGFFV